MKLTICSRHNPCGLHGRCESLSFDGSDAFQCHCKPGWTGERCEIGKQRKYRNGNIKVTIQRSTIVRQIHVSMTLNVSAKTITTSVAVSPDSRDPNVDTVSIHFRLFFCSPLLPVYLFRILDIFDLMVMKRVMF